MKNTVFVSTYHNNPHFIRLQYENFKLFVEDHWDFVVLDDSTPTTRAIVSNNLASEEIRQECIKYGARHIAVPQSVHLFEEQGGLVKNDAPDINLSHGTER